MYMVVHLVLCARCMSEQVFVQVETMNCSGFETLKENENPLRFFHSNLKSVIFLAGEATTSKSKNKHFIDKNNTLSLLFVTSSIIRFIYRSPLIIYPGIN